VFLSSCFRLLAIGVCLLAALPLHARAAAPLDPSGLARQDGWLRLGHYVADPASPSGFRSAIFSDTFFLSPAGRTDPEAELRATLAAMAAPGPAGDAHPQCRFPARRLWIARQWGAEQPFALRPCPTFDDWTRKGTIGSVSIVLANGFLGNPASYYGHTFLKLNFDGDPTRSGLQDLTLNYGAIDTAGDDPVSYIVKGVLGGYDGGFSEIGYYFHENNYGENELRDLWEYRLSLPQAQVDLIVAHAWEVLNKRYRYYFFRENCAFRMTEIVQVVEGLDLIPADRPWTVPLSVLQQLPAARYRGQAIMGAARYQPSRQTRFYRSYRNLDGGERALLKALVAGDEALTGPAFEALPVEARHAVLDAGIDYFQFIADPDARARGVVDPRYARALATRYALPPGSRPLPQAVPPPPHEGRSPSWVQVGAMGGNVSGGWALLRLRPAYYDPLDSDSSHIPNATLAMGDVQLLFRAQEVRLRRLDLISIESAAPGVSGLPGDRGFAWKLKFGAEQARLACGDCLVPRLQGDMGVGRTLAEGVFLAGFVGGALQQDRHRQGAAFGRASVDLIVRPRSDLGLRVGVEQRFPVEALGASYRVARVEARYGLGKQADLRLRHEADGSGETSVGLGFYW